MTTYELVYGYYVLDMLTASIFMVVQEAFLEYPEVGWVIGNYIPRQRQQAPLAEV
jgi:hypothetical protein